jgi:hypothetical protein
MRANATISITAGTPQNLATMLGLLPGAPGATQIPILANRVDAQMAEGTASFGYYMDLANFAAGTVANKATAGHVTQQLQPSTATAPGVPFVDAPAGVGVGAARDIAKIWLDVSVTASVVVSADLRV